MEAIMKDNVDFSNEETLEVLEIEEMEQVIAPGVTLAE